MKKKYPPTLLAKETDIRIHDQKHDEEQEIDVRKGNYVFILAGVFLAGILALGIYLFYFLRQPLNQQLNLEPLQSTTDSNGQKKSAPPATPTTIPFVGAAHSVAEDVCGQSGAYTFLIIGSDAGDMRGRPGSDLTRLVRVDFSHRKVSIFALPRDLWVDVRSLGFQDPLITDTALGMAYYEAHERSIQPQEPGKMTDGAQASGQMILDNFDVISDHYVVIDLSQLPTWIDAIGGLPIDIPERITDPWIGMVIEPGPQTLSGDQLIAYARAIPDSDFDRIQRSNLTLHALRLKLLDPSVWVKWPMLYDQFNEMFVTDLSPQQIFGLVCLLREVPKEEILMEHVKPEWTSPGPSDSLLWNKDEILSTLKQLDMIQ